MSLTEERNVDWPSINDYYAHKDIFVTGATGFLGKCLVEKLLRDIPDIGRVMILIRQKRGKSVQERLRKDVLSSRCFDRIRESRPEALQKVVPISGNIKEPILGIGQEDVKLITENVAVVFHLAATVKFDAPLRESLTLNVMGVKELVKLCRGITRLEALIHISTAFAHCNKADIIEEIIYPPEIHPDKVLGLLDWMTDEQLEGLGPTMLEGRPNTYTYTKALAEYVLVNDGQDLPISIVRPSIVSCSSKEPFPGWVDAIHGATGVFVAIGKGLLRVLRCKETGISDMIPVDLLNNVIISAGWMMGVAPSTEPIIYQYTSGSKNPIQWRELYPLVISSYTSKPFDEIFRRPHVINCRPRCAWKYWHLTLHLIPGFFADLLLRLQGKKPRMVNMYRKLESAVLQIDYFTQNHWDWAYTNCSTLLSLLSEEDRLTYDFDITKLVWKDYVTDFAMGTKLYLLNEDPANVPIARKQIKRLRNIRYTFNLLIFLVATRLVYIKSRIARELWSSMLGLCIQMVIKLSTFLIK